MNATYRYLLDTNIISDLVRHPQGTAAEHIAVKGEKRICTSIVVAAELRFGIIKRDSNRLKLQLESILSKIEILPFQSPADEHYANIRQHLEVKGRPIGPNDLLIAAHALSLNLILVSANLNEFLRVPGLVVENWLE
jgi:tRNA(fMet)-specific endonuclease VapC